VLRRTAPADCNSVVRAGGALVDDTQAFGDPPLLLRTEGILADPDDLDTEVIALQASRATAAARSCSSATSPATGTSTSATPC
jgi:hypothetical protein